MFGANWTDLSDSDRGGLDLGVEAVLGHLQDLQLLRERRLAQDVLEQGRCRIRTLILMDSLPVTWPNHLLTIRWLILALKVKL